MTEREYHSLTEIIDCLTAAKTLGLKNVTVSSTFRPTSSDPEFVPSSWTYRVTLNDQADTPKNIGVYSDEYALLFANSAEPTHLHLGVHDCPDCEPEQAAS